ncbi:hypothetical protein JZ751_025290 [Albula glossodonta]|uniref:AIG1-type G domain-containing protein n=1 Tax=Albula glossodonta TaxID=121402 RepID=A0A8T2NHT2_9TELE|nr:hypothetical protein JZ751_025290 [Albula glossodonta]
MECDCKPDSACTSTSVCGDKIDLEDAVAGLSSLWSWVSRLLNAVRGHSRHKSPKIEQSTNPTSLSSPDGVTLSPVDTGLRLILVGPRHCGRSSLGAILLCNRGAPGALGECVSHRAFMEGREVTIVDTPDLLGSSLEAADRAREALRSIQLASPGPHAFLLVLQAPGSRDIGDLDEAGALRALLALMGEGALNHILPIFTHADSLGGSPTLTQLLQTDPGGLRATLAMCSQRAELVDIGPACSSAQRKALGMRLLERVEEMKTLGGHYVHDLQRREDRIREKLLEDMAAVLERSLEVREKEA